MNNRYLLCICTVTVINMVFGFSSLNASHRRTNEYNVDQSIQGRVQRTEDERLELNPVTESEVEAGAQGKSKDKKNKKEKKSKASKKDKKEKK